jgi:exopolysaccharide biosynthesis protein
VGLIAADGTEVEEAVGGFPLLVRDGRNVVAEQPGIAASFGPARHPRTAVGWSVDRLLLVVVDGRQPGWSAGMSLDELADLMQRLGATDAVNLDGGGSSAMVVRGVVVNRPSDANGERAVGNALVLEACA